MKELIETDVGTAIGDNGCSLTSAAAALDVSRRELAGFLAQKPIFQQMVDSAREEIADDAQGVLGEAVEAGEAWAIRFTLNTYGTQRG